MWKLNVESSMLTTNNSLSNVKHPMLKAQCQMSKTQRQISKTQCQKQPNVKKAMSNVTRDGLSVVVQGPDTPSLVTFDIAFLTLSWTTPCVRALVMLFNIHSWYGVVSIDYRILCTDTIKLYVFVKNILTLEKYYMLR